MTYSEKECALALRQSETAKHVRKGHYLMKLLLLGEVQHLGDKEEVQIVEPLLRMGF